MFELMHKKNSFRSDESAAATELGYIFTFMLGTLLLTMFTIWAFDIETSTRDRWNEQAIQENVEKVASAIERADYAARTDANSTYAEPIKLLALEANEETLTLSLNDVVLSLVDSTDSYGFEVPISATGPSNHSGTVDLGVTRIVWVSYANGMTIISENAPDSESSSHN